MPSGLGLSIGEQSKVTLHYRNCNNAGCWIQHVIDGKSLEALKSNEAAFANIHLINGQNLNIKFSLKGFKEALKALEVGEAPKEILMAAAAYSAGKYFSSTIAEANSALISRFSSDRLSFSL